MKRFLIAAAIATAVAATVTLVKDCLADRRQDESKLLDKVMESYARYHSRKLFLANYHPLANEIEEGAKILDDFIEVERATNHLDNAERLQGIKDLLEKSHSEAEEHRKLRLSDHYSWDFDNFAGRLGDYDPDELSSLYHSMTEAIQSLEKCIKQIEDDANFHKSMYAIAKIGYKCAPKDTPADTPADTTDADSDS